ncbi:LytTR family transcriptional regulator DNA-binding domain-containing protein [uncultured Roseivirga sp.]|uniref:LytR/AlgR family response regulator transcription factor n=1 Tax=uncultured Roseivirga sp. TaxID=543088 RepID=UPI0030DB449A|tara:strand:+ start:46 stop:819 length:774 start_codon:yes stop_codon:yes gene_type:complete
MEKVRVLVVEDEVIIAQSIISMIEKMGYECVGTAIRATKGLELAKALKPDIALLDINLKGEETGIWLASELKRELNIPYVFLTSLGDKKTIEEATSTMPYGYLLKPVAQQSVYAAIETALARFSQENKTPAQKEATLSVSKSFDEKEEEKPSLLIKDALFIKDEYQYVKIILSEIDYIKSDGNYIEIHSQGKKKVLKETLKNMETKLPADIFFQIHRSYLVNVERIESIGGNSIKVNNEELPIVKERRDALLAYLPG